MVSRVGAIGRPGSRETAKLLVPFPGRGAIVTRIVLIARLCDGRDRRAVAAGSLNVVSSPRRHPRRFQLPK